MGVHLIEKPRAYEGDHSTSHGDRAQFVRSNCRPINPAYTHLYDASLEARYKSRGAFTLTPQEVQDELIDKHLRAIENYVAVQTAAKTSGVAGS